MVTKARPAFDVATAAADLETADVLDILRWGAQRFGRLTFATGFGAEGCVVIDLIARHQLPIDLFTLDTGVLFPETYELWRTLEQHYGVTIRAVTPELTIPAQALVHGPRLWERDPDGCCELRKIIPLRNELLRHDAWITAIRRDQTPERATARVVEHDRKFGLVKINPLVRWTHDDVWGYVYENDVPVNALHDLGYPSIGCAPCTSPVRDNEDRRSGRWRAMGKRECGLHVVEDDE